MTLSTKHRVPYTVVFCCFFASGFCSLLYQVVWTRLAFAHFGIVTPVLSIIISVFMLGIGLGSLYGGRWAEFVSGRFGVSAAFLYAALEAAIGAGAFAVPLLFDWGESVLLRAGAADSAAYLLVSAGFITIAVLPWTVAMGATIPVMMAFVRGGDALSVSSFSFLYLANVIGGAIGALAEAFVLIELLGIKGTYEVAGFVNVLLAVTAVVIGAAAGPYAAARRSNASPGGESGASMNLVPWVAVILFATGFCSVGMEVAWARDFTFSLRTTIYAFAAILAVYLLATALGSFVYRKTAAGRTQRSAGSLKDLVAWAFVASLLPVVAADPRLGPSVVRTLASIVPFCAVLGYLTPALIDYAGRNDPVLTGRYYGINVAGCILGPLAAGYLLLAVVGIRWTLIALALPLLVIAAGSERKIRNGVLTAASVFVLAVAVSISRAYDDPSLFGKHSEVRRDYVASVIATGSGMDKQLFVNAVGITALTTVTKVMAHLPMAIDGHATRALDICFGMGTTFRSLMSWNVDVTAVDLSKAVIDSFGYFYPNAATLRTSANAHLVADDGRRYLMRKPDTFDVITIDPPPPVEAAGSSLLYSEQMYGAIKRRLRPGGVLAQWIPVDHGSTLQSVALALVRSFPYVTAYRDVDGGIRGVHFIASMTPIPRLTAKEFVARMPRGARRDLLEWQKNVTVETMASKILDGEIPLSSVLPADSSVPPLTDDRPFNEYFMLRLLQRRF